MTIEVTSSITPTFAPIAPRCQGEAFSLPTTSTNGISGTWFPAPNLNQTTTYVFTPAPDQCAGPTGMQVVVTPKAIPEFNPVGPICAGATIPPLPGTSINGVSGAWSPALNNMETTTYTFTPYSWECSETFTLTIEVNEAAIPLFDIVAEICAGDSVSLPTVSNNDISGTWSPAFDNTQTTEYTFTPSAGVCAESVAVTIVVNEPWLVPEFANIGAICLGSPSPLPNTSVNGVTGTWSPDFDSTQTLEYTFTPDGGQCALEITATVTVVDSVTAPVLDALAYCDPNSDGFGVFDLTQVISGIEDANTIPVIISFHETIEDADFNANPIDMYNPLDMYPNNKPYNQTIYVRVDSDTDCYAVTELELIVHNLPQILTSPAPLELCDEGNNGFAVFDLTVKADEILNRLNPVGHQIRYYRNEDDARNNPDSFISNPGAYTNVETPQDSVWVRVDDLATGCFAVTELILIVHPLPHVSLPEVERYVLCDDDTDGYAEFDLETRIELILNGQSGLTVTFHDSYAEAEAGINAYDYLHTNNEPFVETVFVRVTTEPGCFVITLMDLVVEPLPVLTPPTNPVVACDGDGDGYGVVNLEDVLEEMFGGADASAYDISFHETYTDADLNANEITNPEEYFNLVEDAQTIYIRVAFSDADCGVIYPFTIVLEAAPVLPIEIDGTLPDLTVCDENTDGFASFDLSEQTDYILSAQADTTDLEITYHLSEDNANDGVLAIGNSTNYPNVTNPQTIWVRLENTTTGCYDVASFDLLVNVPLELPVPPAITVCDQDGDLEVSFDLTIRMTDILIHAPHDPSNYLIEFFHTYQGALEGDIPQLITTPEDFSNAELGGGGVYTLGIRVTDITTGCMSYTIMDIRRAPMPNVPSDPLSPLETCDDDDDGLVSFDLTQYESYIRNGDPHLIITYHLTQEDADAGQGAIGTPEDYFSGNATIYIRVANPPNGGVSCFEVLELELIVNPLPVMTRDVFAVCETDATGTADFYFPDFNPQLLGPTQDLADFTISYYLTEDDAVAGTNFIPQGVPYTNQTQGELIWVKIVNNETGCTRIAEITLLAEESA